MPVVASASGDLAASLKGVGLRGGGAGSWARGSVAPGAARSTLCTPVRRWAEPDARRRRLAQRSGGHLGTLSKNNIIREVLRRSIMTFGSQRRSNVIRVGRGPSSEGCKVGWNRLAGEQLEIGLEN